MLGNGDRVALHTTISLPAAAAAIGQSNAVRMWKAFHASWFGTTVTAAAMLDRDGYIRSATLEGTANQGAVHLRESFTIDDINTHVPPPTPPPASETQAVDVQAMVHLVQQAE